MTWSRSLYWRIAIGFVGCLALTLVIQALLFTWAVAWSGRTLPSQTPFRLAQRIAANLASAVARDPQTDIEDYVRDQYADVTYPFAVVLADGRIVATSANAVPESLLHAVSARLARRPDEFGQPEQPLAYRLLRAAPIVVHDETVGAVVVPPRAPFAFLLRRFGLELGVVAIGVLAAGTIVASLVIFGPARRRLRALENAARRVGSGDLSARAPDRGGDEIASVARAFNTMAVDLAARAEALATSDRVRRQLLADVSHELTTPVTAMRGYLETLQMPELALDDATRARYLDILSDETTRLERIIGDLLDLARVEGGGGTFDCEPVPVADLFARVVARHERAAAAAHVRLEQSIAPGAETIDGDRDRLEQVLQNLASNAIRYAPPESAIELGAATSPRGVVLTVVDHGSGITPEHLPYVFDRFYKADPARAGLSGGSGLGLSIVKAIVERLGGRVGVDSQPGRTTFRVELPETSAGA